MKEMVKMEMKNECESECVNLMKMKKWNEGEVMKRERKRIRMKMS